MKDILSIGKYIVLAVFTVACRQPVQNADPPQKPPARPHVQFVIDRHPNYSSSGKDSTIQMGLGLTLWNNDTLPITVAVIHDTVLVVKKTGYYYKRANAWIYGIAEFTANPRPVRIGGRQHMHFTAGLLDLDNYTDSIMFSIGYTFSNPVDRYGLCKMKIAVDRQKGYLLKDSSYTERDKTKADDWY